MESLNLKFMGYVRTTKAAVGYMRERQWGRIINVSSRGSTFPGAGPYDPERRLGDDLLYGPEKSALERLVTKRSVRPAPLRSPAAIPIPA